MKLRLALVVFALGLAVAPLPAPAVERLYSRGLYPPLQGVVTGASNLVPVALLDVAALALLATMLVRLARLPRWGARLRWLAGRLTTAAAIVYILFAVMWGLNYRRARLEDVLAFDASRVTPQALVRLANHGIARANAGHAAAHAQAPDGGALERAFSATVLALGAPRAPRTGVPKASLLSLYFRRAGIDGMTDPWFLEIILNPDVLAVERPFVLAHEWAHLAGYAHESEANFVAWLTCLRGDALARYSAALATYGHAVARMPERDVDGLVPFDSGPRADLHAISERYRSVVPLVRRASREVYDSYLKANRVEEGVAAYDLVVRLMLGTELDAEGLPRLRNGELRRRPTGE
jgi:hypothetical protein